MLFKFLLGILIVTLIFRLLGYWLRAKISSTINNQQDQQKQYQKPKDGNVDINYVPGDKQEHIKGGDYVDYEDVK